MDAAQKLLWRKALLSGAGMIMTGVVLYKYTTPTEEQLVAKLSPELRADYEKNKELRRKEQQVLMEIVKQTSASNDPIWKTGAIKSPWDKDNIQTGDSILVKKNLFERQQADLKQQQELERMKKEVELTEVIQEKTKNGKSWYKLW